MNARARRAATILFAAAAAVFALDRVTKVWAAHVLVGRPIDLIPGALTLRYTTNSGGAFSLGQRTPWLFAGATLIVSGLIVLTAFRSRNAVSALGLGLVLGGALGNLADRALRGHGLSGHVVDFIDLHWWPVFNVADSAIVIGAVLLAWTSFRDEHAREVAAGTPDDVA
ncbi:MAG: signal peptidase II [Actinobacteria bacterium]|nr:MAG: signal peptidase II [Actinomycetota bacterium]